MENLNSLISQNIGVVAIALGGMALIALLLAAGATSRLRSLAGRFAWVTGDGSGSPDTLDALLKTVVSNQRTIGVINSTLEKAIEDARGHIRRIGMVRYDAFEGIAGHQSFSLCMLDDLRNGVLITSLVGREFSRSYAVEVKDGQPSRKLGDEETAALRKALEFDD